MNSDPKLAAIGAALGDPSRARMLCGLMDGRAFTNKELALMAGIGAPTASAHLRQLERVGLIVALRSGRRVYHRIANESVARTLEALACLSPDDHLTRLRRRGNAPELIARTCYNHIAGRLGVLLADRLEALEAVRLEGETAMPGPRASAVFARLGLSGIDMAATTGIRPCLDWSERRVHLAGPLATALMKVALERRWLYRQATGRGLTISAEGFGVFGQVLGLTQNEIFGK